MPFDETNNPLWRPQPGDSNTIELVESFPTKDWGADGSDGSSKAGSEEEFITAIHKDGPPAAATNAKVIRRRRLGILLAILVIVVGVVAMVVMVLTTKDDSESESAAPFSALDPVTDLGLFKFTRPEESSPSSRLKLSRKALPTNAWYQNLLLLQPNQEPSELHRVYTIPYVVDTAGPIPGLRIHAHHLDATSTTVILAVTEAYAVTLGATREMNTQEEDTNGYSVVAATDLGVTLEWVRSTSIHRNLSLFV
jgi:hypothetical protein